jgi:hypothetical protein
VGTDARGEKPLNGENPGRGSRDETCPRSGRAEKVVERLRKPEDGTEWRRGNLRVEWTLSGGVAKREETLGRWCRRRKMPAGGVAKEL